MSNDSRCPCPSGEKSKLLHCLFFPGSETLTWSINVMFNPHARTWRNRLRVCEDQLFNRFFPFWLVSPLGVPWESLVRRSRAACLIYLLSITGKDADAMLMRLQICAQEGYHSMHPLKMSTCWGLGIMCRESCAGNHPGLFLVL